MNLRDKVAIVTGASREIGAAMAEALAGAGAAVLVAHHGESALADAVVARISAAGRAGAGVRYRSLQRRHEYVKNTPVSLSPCLLVTRPQYAIIGSCRYLW